MHKIQKTLSLFAFFLVANFVMAQAPQAENLKQ